MLGQSLLLRLLPAFIAAAGSASATSISSSSSSAINTTVCNGQEYIYQELAGYGFLAHDARDRFGDSMSFGSSIALDKRTWTQRGNQYEGILYALPDRGWNTNGTINFQSRIYKLHLTLTLDEKASVEKPSGPNLDIKYLDSILLRDPRSQFLSGLDADAHEPYLTFSNFPDVPSATYSGDGFGGNGTGGRRISFDSEGLVLGVDGSFWISDEYGPYVYQFTAQGKLVQAIRPPDAFIPLRNGSESFSSDSAPIYNPSSQVVPEDNPTGRDNNQGFEGLTVSSDGKTLYVLTQSALNQEGGLKKKNRRHARFIKYDISRPQRPVYTAEYVVPLPLYNEGDKVAAQSEIHYISDTQFLILARDSGAGHGQDDSQSVYRHADVFDIANATNIKSLAHDSFNGSIASTKGALDSGVQPALYCPWLDFNVNSQLNRFGVHNGGNQDAALLNEKWESLALLPVNLNRKNDDHDENEYFLFSFSDNDFITQNGYQNFGRYRYQDGSGYDLDNQALVFKVKLPKNVQPLEG